MTSETKKRIAHINAGEIPAGYKKTKVGIVPSEWEITKLSNILTQRKTLQCISDDAPLLSFTIEEGVIDPSPLRANPTIHGSLLIHTTIHPESPVYRGKRKIT